MGALNTKEAKTTKSRIELNAQYNSRTKIVQRGFAFLFEWDLDFNFGLKLIARLVKNVKWLRILPTEDFWAIKKNYSSSESESESWSGRSSGKSSYSFSGVSGLVTTGCLTWNENKNVN